MGNANDHERTLRLAQEAAARESFSKGLIPITLRFEANAVIFGVHPYIRQSILENNFHLIPLEALRGRVYMTEMTEERKKRWRL
jgi:hypothetical protein